MICTDVQATDGVAQPTRDDDDDDDDQPHTPMTSGDSTSLSAGEHMPMDPAVEALIRQSILFDMDEESEANVLDNTHAIQDPALIPAWQQAHDAALAATIAPDALQQQDAPAPEVMIRDLTDPRPGVAAIEGPLDDPEQEIALREVFPAAFDAALDDCNQWSRIIRCVEWLPV